MARKPLHVALVLLGALLAVVPSHLASGAGSPAFIEGAEWLRLVLGLPAVLLLPGLVLAPLLMPRDLVRDESLSISWTVFAALGLNVLVYVVHLNALRFAGIAIEWPALIALTALETVGLGALLHRRSPQLRFRPLSPGLRSGGAAIAFGVLGAGLLWGTEITVDSSWNYYTEALNEPIEQPVDPGALRFDRKNGAMPWRAGEPFVPASSEVRLVIYNPADQAQEVPVLFLLHGPIGTRGTVRLGDQDLAADEVKRLVPLTGLDALVERYWDWGSVALLGTVPVDASSERTVVLDLQAPDGAAISDLAVAEWSALSNDEFLEFTRVTGFRFMHPFQMLNVTENVRWADEVAGEYVLSGRAPDGSSTLHQPPGWTYLYAPAREMLSPHLVTGSSLLLAILALIALASLAGAESVAGTPLTGRVGLLLGVGVTAMALQHGRMMVSDGSVNFPDNLYALALLLSVLLLVTGRTRTFLVWAFLATILRYPGAVVVALAAGSLAVLRADLRRRVIDAAMRFGLAVAAFCGVMLMVAVLTGALDQWLFALWFETIPEHFDNNPDADPLWKRPIEFLRIWGLVGGAAVFASLPLRGTLSRVALATALLYAPFLAFIDHFSHHYFLPLIALIACSAAANAASADTERSQITDAAAFAVVAVLLLGAATRLGV
ncbi:MAG: hypothetical protein KDA24_22120 [Deltaproteobacteria bacterium]|nr:hypothetical protein [Deltaproteobacteria bacterium]